MAVLVFRVVPGVLFLAYMGLLAIQSARWLRREKAELWSGWRDRLTVGLFALGHAPAALYFGGTWMDPFHVHVPPVLRLGGLLLFLAGEILLFAAHRALGQNWSPLLEIRPGHTLTTYGPYRCMRHPMYAALLLMALGLPIMSANWAVGAAFLGPLALLYALRAPEEEEMLQACFGAPFRAYAERTERLLPGSMKETFQKRQVRAAMLFVGVTGATGCGAVALDGLSDELGRADVAVVLGCRVYGNGQPGPSLKSRLNETIRLYHRGWFSEIFVSGAVGRDGYDEAVVMRRYLVEHEIPAERVHVDSRGVNTNATARNAAAFMRDRGMRSAMVVTQFYHVPRSQMALRNAGVANVYGAHARFFAWQDVYLVPRELFATAWYCLRESWSRSALGSQVSFALVTATALFVHTRNRTKARQGQMPIQA